MNWQAGPCDHGGQDFVPSSVRSKPYEGLGNILGLIIASKNMSSLHCMRQILYRGKEKNLGPRDAFLKILGGF